MLGSDGSELPKQHTWSVPQKKICRHWQEVSIGVTLKLTVKELHMGMCVVEKKLRKGTKPLRQHFLKLLVSCEPISGGHVACGSAAIEHTEWKIQDA